MQLTVTTFLSIETGAAASSLTSLRTMSLHRTGRLRVDPVLADRSLPCRR
jgi:hypothetical protein